VISAHCPRLPELQARCSRTLSFDPVLQHSSCNVATVQSVEFLINGDPSLARNTAAEILAERGFTLTWTSEWSAAAVRGSTAGNVLLGGFAQKFEVGLSVTSAANGQSVIRFDRKNKGWMFGGALGAARISRNMNELRDQFRDAMTTRGMLAGIKET
jgi:hypothetical protein